MSAPAPLDESDLVRLVDRFYDKVRQDPSLGPVFAVVHDWEGHKRLLVSFWASVALRAGSYRGNPMGVHRAVPGIRAAHFDRWLALWAETTREVLAPQDAEAMLGHARRIGAGLRLGLGLPEAGTRELDVNLMR